MGVWDRLLLSTRFLIHKRLKKIIERCELNSFSKWCKWTRNNTDALPLFIITGCLRDNNRLMWSTQNIFSETNLIMYLTQVPNRSLLLRSQVNRISRGNQVRDTSLHALTSSRCSVFKHISHVDLTERLHLKIVYTNRVHMVAHYGYLTPSTEACFPSLFVTLASHPIPSRHACSCGHNFKWCLFVDTLLTFSVDSHNAGCVEHSTLCGSQRKNSDLTLDWHLWTILSASVSWNTFTKEIPRLSIS